LLGYGGVVQKGCAIFGGNTDVNFMVPASMADQLLQPSAPLHGELTPHRQVK
jgi:hypothetical protein